MPQLKLSQSLLGLHMPQLKLSHAASKTWSSQTNKLKKREGGQLIIQNLQHLLKTHMAFLELQPGFTTPSRILSTWPLPPQAWSTCPFPQGFSHCSIRLTCDVPEVLSMVLCTVLSCHFPTGPMPPLESEAQIYITRPNLTFLSDPISHPSFSFECPASSKIFPLS